MLSVTDESSEVLRHLEKVFRGRYNCQGCHHVFGPPIGVPFQVVEPLEIRVDEESLAARRGPVSGPASDLFIPAGIYGGLEAGGGRILQDSNVTHIFFIRGLGLYGTRRICVRIGMINIDWRGVLPLNG